MTEASRAWIDLDEAQRRHRSEERTQLNDELDPPRLGAESEPMPLLAPGQSPKPYPSDALSPTLRNAVLTYQKYGQQPLALVACSALAAASLATQGLANVARDKNLIGPVSLNVLIVADSGERKTSADRRFARPARQWEAEQRETLKPQYEAKKAAVLAHAAECDGLIAKIKSASGKNGTDADADLADLKRRLAELKASPPPSPILPALFHEDVTPEGLAQEIAAGWPSSSLWSDEGGLVVGSHGMSDDSAMRFLALLNRLWDGNSFERKRSAAKSFAIIGRRLTSSLMMQEVVLTRLLSAAGGSARGTGFLARSLLCWPSSTMGTRLYVEGDIDGPELRAFDQRVRGLLDLPLPAIGSDMILELPTITFSPEAHKLWIEFHNAVELEIGRTGEHRLVADFASKSAEQAARIAAVFHVFENGPEGVIQAETMAAGAKLAAWHLFEARRMITATDQPQEIADALLLEEWLRSRDLEEIEMREILRLGPPQLREKRRRNAAIARLVEFAHAAEIVINGRAHLRLNPKLRLMS